MLAGTRGDFRAGARDARRAKAHPSCQRSTRIWYETIPARQDFPSAIWVSHDAGDTWHQVAIVKSSSYRDMATVLASATYRDGVLYAAIPESIQAVPRNFVRSTDDGATWTRTEAAPSALERAGWGAYAFTSDYSAPHSWYRTLAKSGGASMLEHSSDDGRAWNVIGPVGNLRGDGSESYQRVENPTEPSNKSRPYQ